MNEDQGIMAKIADNHPLVAVITMSIISLVGIASVTLVSFGAMRLFSDMSSRLN